MIVADEDAPYARLRRARHTVQWRARTIRAFAKVKSSAIMARQPSVPKRIESIGFEYTRSRSFANGPDWQAYSRSLRRFSSSHFIPLRRPGRAREDKSSNGVVSFDYNQIVHPMAATNLDAVQKRIAAGIQGVPVARQKYCRQDISSATRKRQPRTRCRSSPLPRDDENGWGTRLAGCRLENGVIH